MFSGLILVFGLILWMNHYMGKVEKKSPQEVTELSVAKEIKPEPKKKSEKRNPRSNSLVRRRPRHSKDWTPRFRASIWDCWEWIMATAISMKIY